MIQGEPKGQMNPFCLSLPSQLVHLITFNAGGTHPHSTKRNKCKSKWLKTPQYRRKLHLTFVRTLYRLINAIFSQGLLSVLASLDTALGYVATNATKPQKFTL